MCDQNDAMVVIKILIEDVVKGQGLSVILSLMNENQSSVLVMLNEGFVLLACVRIWNILHLTSIYGEVLIKWCK